MYCIDPRTGGPGRLNPSLTNLMTRLNCPHGVLIVATDARGRVINIGLTLIVDAASADITKNKQNIAGSL